MTNSLANSIASLPASERQSLIASLSDDAAKALVWDWSFWARPNQLPPQGAWIIWLLLAGRGFGKSRTGAEWIRAQVESGSRSRLALIGATAADARDVMVEGDSGLLAISPPWFRPRYEPSKRRVTWPNGAIATLYSADEPERLRGPQHDGGWLDELGAWRYAEAWDMFMLGLRLGINPQAVVTTTPRPTPLIKDLVRRDGQDVHVTRGNTYDNAANLAQAFINTVIRKYEGSRLGRQELMAELLLDTEGALWTLALIESTRVAVAPALTRIAVGVDPSVTSGEDSAETGIVVDGVDRNGDGYTLADYSVRGTPLQWGAQVVKAYHDFKADCCVVETNNGGEMIGQVIKSIDRGINIKEVHASRGKLTRAEPVSALYEQGRWHHVGAFKVLEDQMCTYVPGEISPDHMDAHVWSATELTQNQKKVLRAL